MSGSINKESNLGQENMKIQRVDSERYQDLFTNLIHLYVLHRTSQEPVFGLQIIEELSGFGYKPSPGTIYPLLETLEQKGLVRSREESNGSARRLYRATAAGRKALSAAQGQVRQLIGDVYKKSKKTGSRGGKAHRRSK